MMGVSIVGWWYIHVEVNRVEGGEVGRVDVLHDPMIDDGS